MSLQSIQGLVGHTSRSVTDILRGMSAAAPSSSSLPRPAAANTASVSVGQPAPAVPGPQPLLLPGIEAVRVQAVRKLCNYFAAEFAPVLGGVGAGGAEAVDSKASAAQPRRANNNNQPGKGKRKGKGKNVDKGKQKKNNKWHTHFEAWLWDQRARVPQEERAAQDPVIPTGPSTADAPELEHKLRRAGVSKRVRREMCRKLSKQAGRIRAALDRKIQDISQSRGASKVQVEQLVVRRRQQQIQVAAPAAAEAASAVPGSGAGSRGQPSTAERAEADAAGAEPKPEPARVPAPATSDAAAISTLFVSGLPSADSAAGGEAVANSLRARCTQLAGFEAFSFADAQARFPYAFVKYASPTAAVAAAEQLRQLRVAPAAGGGGGGSRGPGAGLDSNAATCLHVQMAKRNLKVAGGNKEAHSASPSAFATQKKWTLVCQGVTVEINEQHYEAMKRRFQRNTPRQRGTPSRSRRGGAADAADTGAAPRRSLASFHDALFCCLARYSALQGGHPRGGGCQAALFHDCFRALQSDFGVTAECFASPMNCFPGFHEFCSAFEDTDGPFGSLGSFFDFHPRCGSFEANPPFQPEVVSLMHAHMHRLLRVAERRHRTDTQTAGSTRGDKDDSALSFIVIIPHWPEKPCWAALATSKFCRRHVDIPAAEHGYFEGAQHSKSNQVRQANAASSVFWLQTTEAQRRWPCTDAKLERLLAAFRPVQAASKAGSKPCRAPAATTAGTVRAPVKRKRGQGQ